MRMQLLLFEHLVQEYCWVCFHDLTFIVGLLEILLTPDKLPLSPLFHRLKAFLDSVYATFVTIFFT